MVAEARKEARRRGNADTQTSDARFDERFQLGHGLSGPAGQPWYAQRRPGLLDGDADVATGSMPAVARLEVKFHFSCTELSEGPAVEPRYARRQPWLLDMDKAEGAASAMPAVARLEVGHSCIHS